MAKKKEEVVAQIVSVSPAESAKLIRHCMNKKRPIMLWGPPGIGKSDIIAQIGKSFEKRDEDGNVLVPERPIIDIRLLLHDPTDLKGMPYFDFNEGRMKWSQPSELPMVVTLEQIKEAESELAFFEQRKARVISDESTSTDELHHLNQEITTQRSRVNVLKGAWGLQNAILFFDELPSAPQTVQGAAFQLILNRKIGEYTLPDGVDIVAAGNRDTDRGITFRMPKPLQNRFIHLNLDVRFEDWQEWALTNDIHPDVIGFLTQHSQHLFSFDPKSASNAFPTPRSWKFLSDLLCDSFMDDSFYPLAAGSVGDGVAVEFMAHRKVSAHMPNPLDIITGRHKEALKVKEISALYSLVISMAYRLNEKYIEAKETQKGRTVGGCTMEQFNSYVNNFFTYLLDNMSPEMCVMASKLVLNTYKIEFSYKDLKSFRTFYDKYHHLILS